MGNFLSGFNTQVAEVYTNYAILIAWHGLCYNLQDEGFFRLAHFKARLAARGKKKVNWEDGLEV